MHLKPGRVIQLLIRRIKDNIPAGTWLKNDVVSTSMRRDDVASTLIRRHFVTKCPLGFVEALYSPYAKYVPSIPDIRSGIIMISLHCVTSVSRISGSKCIQLRFRPTSITAESDENFSKFGIFIVYSFICLFKRSDPKELEKYKVVFLVLWDHCA